MKKILIPTDFSAKSAAGLRFVLQWSTQEKLELVFVYVCHILRPTQWSNTYFIKYAAQEKKIYRAELEKFVTRTCTRINIKSLKHSFVLLEGFNPGIAIMDYCRENPDIDFICISTRGAGKLKKIMGTNTGNLITKSEVPVIAIPTNYRTGPIRHLLYATDFRNCLNELRSVVSFARPLKASIEVLHFAWPDEVLLDEKLIEKIFIRELKYSLKFHSVKTDVIYSLVERLQKQIRESRPSVVIMFTDQHRSLFQKIFLSSKSEQLSFQARVPLLVFSKDQPAKFGLNQSQRKNRREKRVQTKEIAPAV
jgi:nucleotide-binding universal stress UspA family protein